MFKSFGEYMYRSPRPQPATSLSVILAYRHSCVTCVKALHNHPTRIEIKLNMMNFFDHLKLSLGDASQTSYKAKVCIYKNNNTQSFTVRNLLHFVH
jgi:hypothetical protein